ncbi:MAG: hypothetical protein EA406_07390 [Rhodospirillales bacterium]|nr:MAG: hypothetical protein EA406_07390 [Rhodospirillales bacterium]
MLPVHRHAIGFLLKHLAAGAAGGMLFGALVLYYDVAGLGTLITTSRHGLLASVMLFFGLFMTFGSVGMGVGIMSLGEERDSDPLPPRRDRDGVA